MRTKLMLVGMAFALVACGKQAPAAPSAVGGGPIVSASLGGDPSVPPAQSADPPSPTSGGGGSGSSGGGSGGANSVAAFTQDDLKVFAYATTDEKTVAGDLAHAATVVSKAETDAKARDLSALRSDAASLATDADRLAKDADAGESRQRPLGPTDDTLVKARKEAIAVFEEAASYATLASQLAELAANPSLQTLQQVLQLAAQLDGASASLTDDLDQLNQLLEQWSQANPAAAAKALATYGG